MHTSLIAIRKEKSLLDFSKSNARKDDTLSLMADNYMSY